MKKDWINSRAAAGKAELTTNKYLL